MHGNAYYNKNGSSFTQSLDLVSENSPKLCEHCSFFQKNVNDTNKKKAHVIIQSLLEQSTSSQRKRTTFFFFFLLL